MAENPFDMRTNAQPEKEVPVIAATDAAPVNPFIANQRGVASNQVEMGFPGETTTAQFRSSNTPDGHFRDFNQTPSTLSANAVS